MDHRDGDQGPMVVPGVLAGQPSASGREAARRWLERAPGGFTNDPGRCRLLLEILIGRPA
jgi:hypothetical protein